MDIRPQIRQKPVRSFVIRSGRMTAGQRAAYDLHWQRFGMDLADGNLDFDEVFGRQAPRILEIGFGMGDSLIEMCERDPSSDFVGIEVHAPGVGRAMNAAAKMEIENFRVFLADARDVLDECISDNSLSRVQIYFPDPWHKKKHNKRRLVQADFVRQISAKLAPGGILHLATDWQHYAEQMLAVANADTSITNLDSVAGYSARPSWRPETKFERRGERLGHGVWDLLYKKNV